MPHYLLNSIPASLLGGVFLFASPIAIAVPVVEKSKNVDEEVVLSGSGFTQGPNVVLFDDFESSTPGAIVDLKDPLIGEWYQRSNNPRYQSEANGNIGFQARNFDLSAGDKLAQLQFLLDSPQREIFYSFSVKVPEGYHFSGASSPEVFPTRSSWKFSWLFSGPTGYGHDNGLFDITVPTHVGNGTFLVGGNTGTLSYIDGGHNWWSWESFNDFSFYMKIADDAEETDMIDWLLRITSTNGPMVRSGEKPRNTYQGTDYQFDRLNFPGWWGNGDSANFSAIYDNIYVAVGENSNSRIVVSDKKNIDQSTRAVSIPTLFWSEKEIRFDASLLPKWDHLYISVVNSQGEYSNSSMYFCPKCPKRLSFD
jgi:hypothetical protein